jgi:hypothetical protein
MLWTFSECYVEFLDSIRPFPLFKFNFQVQTDMEISKILSGLIASKES